MDPALALPTNHGGVPRHGVQLKCPSGSTLVMSNSTETQRVLSIAVELTCIALRTGDCDEGVRQAIARKIIELAQDGERDPNIPLRTGIEQNSRTAGVKPLRQPGATPSHPTVAAGQYLLTSSFVIFYSLQDQIAMPLESTECMLKSTEHRYGHVNFMPGALQLFDLLFFVGDMLLCLRDVAIRLRQVLTFEFRDHRYPSELTG